MREKPVDKLRAEGAGTIANETVGAVKGGGALNKMIEDFRERSLKNVADIERIVMFWNIEVGSPKTSIDITELVEANFEAGHSAAIAAEDAVGDNGFSVTIVAEKFDKLGGIGEGKGSVVIGVSTSGHELE